MLNYTLKRVLYLVPVTVAVVFLVGIMIHLIPGDPVDLIAGDFASETAKAQLRSQLGIDQPVFTQILNYYVRILHGDWGTSLVLRRPVLDLIAERAWPTLELTFGAVLFSCLLSIPLGAFCAFRSGGFFDLLCMGLAFLRISMPSFLLGPILILIFSIGFGWFPVSGRGQWNSALLPAITLGSSFFAVLFRISKMSFAQQLHEDYVRTARAKGLNEIQIFVCHIFKNAAIPIATIIGLEVGSLITGAIIVEKVFDWPGVGTLIAEAIERRDYPVVQGSVFTFSIAFLLTNLCTDLAYHALDPRIRLREDRAA